MELSLKLQEYCGISIIERTHAVYVFDDDSLHVIDMHCMYHERKVKKPHHRNCRVEKKTE